MGSSTAHHQDQSDIENQKSELESRMKSELELLSPLSSEFCIYRVSERLRQVNEKAYVPQVVSIGPLHHGRSGLEPMEDHKKRFLKAYIRHTGKSIKDCISIVKSKEAELRRCYAEPLHLSSNELAKIVLTDAAFLIEVLLRNRFEKFQDDEHDQIFKKPWMLQDIWPDLRLLENQLPFSMVNALFFPENISFPTGTDVAPPGTDAAPTGTDARNVSLLELLHSFFREPMHLEGTEENLRRISPSEVEHFVGFLWRLYMPKDENPREGRMIKTLSTPSVTELHRAGVKFRAAESKCMFDMRFEGGVLKIPKLTISDETELTIRNLLAFEQSHCEGNNYLNDYAVMMDRLVDTAKDVDLLVKHGIVENRLGDSVEAATLVNKLGDGATLDRENFYFASVSERLDAHCKTPWHKWKANLRHDYFNTPWAIASVVAAVLIIVLTIVQAVCSVIQVTTAGDKS